MNFNDFVFHQDKNGIDPAKVPQRTLYTGEKMPCVGMGTFGSDRYSADVIAAAVLGAAEVGFRLFDCASVYGNEDLIGMVFQKMLEGGLNREELFVMSKVWNDKHDDVIGSCKQTLKDLQLDYLDMYFVHWPFPNFHPAGCPEDYRNPNSKPYIHEEFMETWVQMEKLVEMGLVKHIGTSNVTIPKLKLILRDAKIKPAANEMEMHPHFQQQELFDFVRGYDIVPVAFCPIGSPSRPDRDTTATDTVDIQDPVICRIAEKHGVHPAVICIKWAVQRGQTPIPFSIRRENYMSNIAGVVNDPLSEEEMAEIAKIDKNCRLIKGQVFLWEGAKSWEDLWDMNGEITR